MNLYRSTLIALGLWFGFGIAITQFTSADAMQIPRAVLSSLFLWPIAALVLRNLYGDLTGRRVVAGPVYTEPEKRRR